VQGSTWISSLEVDLDDGNLMFLALSISHLVSSSFSATGTCDTVLGGSGTRLFLGRIRNALVSAVIEHDDWFQGMHRRRREARTWGNHKHNTVAPG